MQRRQRTAPNGHRRLRKECLNDAIAAFADTQVAPPPALEGTSAPRRRRIPWYLEARFRDGSSCSLVRNFSGPLVRPTVAWQMATCGAQGRKLGAGAKQSEHEALTGWLANHRSHLYRGEWARLLRIAGAPLPRGAEMDETDARTDAAGGPSGATGQGRAHLNNIRCPFCPKKQFARENHLMRHIATTHEGATFGEAGARVLHAIDRGVCTECGVLRKQHSTPCHCCRNAATARPPSALDEVRTTAGQARRAAKQAGLHATCREPRPSMPDDWAARVRALPHTTVPHIPASARRPMATVMAQCLEAMLEGKEDAQLEQGWSKLLMSPAPNGFDFRTELATRIRLWQADNLDGLLTRIESQALEMARARQSTPEDEAGRARRARRLAREGAYRIGHCGALRLDGAAHPSAGMGLGGETLLPNSTAEAGETYIPPPAQAPGSANGAEAGRPRPGQRRRTQQRQQSQRTEPECTLPITQPLPLIDSDSSGEATSEAAASEQ